MTTLNPHANESPASTPPQADTLNAMKVIKTAMGLAGPAQFAILATALGSVISGLIAALTDERKQSVKLATNKLALSKPKLQVPTVKPVGLNSAVQTVSATLGSVATTDVLKLNQAMATASNVRNPSRPQNFRSKIINQASDASNQRVQALNAHLKTVQGMKEGVQST